ncbi:MAG: hypothetical protein L6Q60_10450 [Rhodocyclaceae bacterium]|nr:hypothetical protein [Rhodocyclaceae bacterium]
MKSHYFPEAGVFVRCMWAALAATFSVANLQAAPTELATKPFSTDGKINALPNVMFILDDSGSMNRDFSPDWAGPYQQMVASVLTTITPPHRFFNSSYNGVAYNPATRYRPPAMFDSSGSLDTTSYPSMDGSSVAAGGDVTATAASRNWRAVKVDGYGVQSALTANLEGAAFSYTTVAGEYCTAANLRTCTAASAPSGSYTFPAPLRWCTTAVLALDTTANAGTSCIASNIEPAAGVTDYTYPRIPRPRTATISVGAAGTVTSITVDGVQILSASATGATSIDVATDIAAKINACTLATTGTCATVGFSATSASNVVTVTAPTATTSTPVVTGGTTTPAAFSGGNVPGATLFTVITPTVSSYAYPGTATKASSRTDCAGTTCTYIEEMTNYANWYAYYRTRMQMMKTSAGIAFSNVDDNYRVGYYSINNATGSDFLNVDTFSGTQKHNWYTKFFAATPFGATPLRTGLANVGRMYAGKLTTMNTVSVVDPVQYSCQQNFSILSTDGYWNDTVDPVQLDGTSSIGNQDGNDPRPYYDGTTQARTVSQTIQTDYQVGYNALLVEQRTQQQQTSTSQLDQGVTTTTTYPFQETLTQLRTQTTPLNKTTQNLESRSYNLIQSSYQLQQRTALITSTPQPLNVYINNLTKTTTPLDKRVYNVTRNEQLVTKKVFNIKKDTQLVTKKVFNIKKDTQLVTQKVFNIKKDTQLVTKNVYNVTRTSYPLQSSTYKLQSSTRQLQKRQLESSDGGDSWIDTGWVNASSCTVTTTGAVTVVSASLWTKNTTCQYASPVVAGGLNSCSVVAASPGPTTYTVGQAVSCSYETTPTVAAVASCTVVAQSGSSPYSPSVSCGYGATSTVTTNQATCTAKDQTGSSTMTGDKMVCSYDTTPTATTNLSTCTWVVPATAASSPKTECSYQSATTLAGQTSCTAAAKNTNTANGQVWNTGVTCTKETTAASTTTNLSTCTWVVPSPANSASYTECSYQTATTLSGQTTCAAAAKATATTNGSVWNTGVTCTKETTAASTTTNLSTCTWVKPSPIASASNTECSYQTATSLSGQTTCTTAAKNTNTANGQVWNTGVTCTKETTAASTTTNLSTCTWVVPSPATSASNTECSYQTATATTNQTSCTAATAATATTNGSVWNTARTCTYDATPTTTAGVASCTWVVPSPSASAPRTDCAYNAGAAATTTVATCTPVAASTGTTNGTVWTGPSVTCNYAAAVLQTAGVASCTWGAPSGAPPYLAYTSCGYTNGTPVTNQNSCTVVAQSTGTAAGTVWTGPANACAYQALGTATNVTSCTYAQQSPTFAAPQVQCSYAAAANTTVASCSTVAQSSGTATGTVWSGPAIGCAYSGTASATNLNATTCTANRQTASPYTGPAVDCNYAAAVVSNNVASCTTQTASPGPTNYVGPAVSCAYGAASGWSDVSSGSCTTVAQSGGSPYAGPARECSYNGVVTTNNVGAPCTDAESTTSPYTVLQKRVCTAGSFPVVTGPVASVVDNCSTAPTSVTDPVSLINVATATTCAYRAPVVTNTATCTPVAASGGSPYVTAVTCPITDTGWVAVAPTCTPIGILGTAGPPVTPPTFDGTGKAVACQSTDQTTYTADYPSGPVPVATCTAGTNPATKVQTTCTEMINTSAPVASCTAIDPATAPSYIRTTCNTTTSSANVMGCSPSSPTSPLYQTITCVDNGDGTSNTLADVAAYYYKTDLRTTALNNCVGAIVPPATTGSVLCSASDPMNNVPTTAIDTNAAQHMTTFTLGLGVSGYMKYSPTYSTDSSGDFPTVKGVAPYAPANGITADPSNGVCPWQSSGLCNWPAPAADEQTAVDDLWHAGVNGRGAYFSATDPVSLGNSISATLAQVAASGGVSAAGSVSSPVLTPADSYVFIAGYTTVDWIGELIRVTLDPISGVPSSTVDWSAQAKLDAKSYSARNIWAYDAGVATTKLKAFTSANYATNSYFNMPHISTSPTGLTQFLCSSADICLSATNQDSSHASGANLVNYLRGERTHEGVETDNTKYFRQRSHVLGDIVNAQVSYVTSPQNNYVDPGYDAFRTSNASRLAMVYVAANDGMLHAFAAKGVAATETLVTAAANARAAASLDPTNATKAADAATATAAATAAISGDTQIGQERWAFIPSFVMPNLYRLADKQYRDKHRYYIDSTPIVGDVCIEDCGDAGAAVWKTILVGGLGRGGRGYYALDITDPANPKALWEFSDADMGYSYGPPQIGKLSDGTWVVLMSSGYNNIPNDDGAGGDGIGRLYIVKASDGTQVTGLSPISTGAGSTTTPSGLGKIAAQVVNPLTDATIGAVYGGDLLGNLWRFDINDTMGAAGNEAFKFAALKDVSGVGQPITTTPIISKARGKFIVLVGTGQLLAASDSSTTAQQTLYGIIDDRTVAQATYDNPGGATTRGANLDFVQQTLTEVDCPTDAITEGLCALGEKVFLNSSNTVDYGTKKGWFMDFIVTGERANTDPVLVLGILGLNTSVPSLAACDVGGKTYQHWVDYQTGGALSPTNISGIKAFDSLSSGITAYVSGNGVKFGTAKKTDCSSGDCFPVNEPPLSGSATPTKRNSWRELIRN